MKNRKSGDIKAPRLVSVNPMLGHAVGQAELGEYKLHLLMDKASYIGLLWLKASLEASSDSEVIRRALQAYQIFEPDDADSKNESKEQPTCIVGADSAEHLYIRLPRRMKEELDAERETSGLSYGEQVRQALRVLMQICRERQSILRKIKGSSSGLSNGKSLEEGDAIDVHRIRAIC